MKLSTVNKLLIATPQGKVANVVLPNDVVELWGPKEIQQKRAIPGTVRFVWVLGGDDGFNDDVTVDLRRRAEDQGMKDKFRKFTSLDELTTSLRQQFPPKTNPVSTNLPDLNELVQTTFDYNAYQGNAEATTQLIIELVTSSYPDSSCPSEAAIRTAIREEAEFVASQTQASAAADDAVSPSSSAGIRPQDDAVESDAPLVPVGQQMEAVDDHPTSPASGSTEDHEENLGTISDFVKREIDGVSREVLRTSPGSYVTSIHNAWVRRGGKGNEELTRRTLENILELEETSQFAVSEVGEVSATVPPEGSRDSLLGNPDDLSEGLGLLIEMTPSCGQSDVLQPRHSLPSTNSGELPPLPKTMEQGIKLFFRDREIPDSVSDPLVSEIGDFLKGHGLSDKYGSVRAALSTLRRKMRDSSEAPTQHSENGNPQQQSADQLALLRIDFFQLSVGMNEDAEEFGKLYPKLMSLLERMESRRDEVDRLMSVASRFYSHLDLLEQLKARMESLQKGEK